MDTNNINFGDLQFMETNQRSERINDVEETSQQMKITDLIQEFLEQIFMYLDFASIVRAADVCTQFRKATKLPFRKKYGRNVVELAITPKTSELYHEKDGHVIITDLKMAMSMLRCFGDNITQLQVMNQNLKSYDDAFRLYCRRRGVVFGTSVAFEEPPPDNTHKLYWERKIRGVLLYANKYCHESLIKLSMDPPIGIDELRKPFSNVQHVCISNFMRTDTFKRHCLNANFPRLRCLTIGTNFEDGESRFAAELLPNLQEFSYILHPLRDFHIVPALQSNPQLQKFTVTLPECFFSFFFEKCVSHLQSIQEFNLIYKIKNPDYPTNCPFYIGGNYKVHLRNVRTFKLHLDYELDERLLLRIPLEFNHLKNFSLEGNFFNCDAFYEFIDNHPTITNLFLKNKLSRNFLDKFKLKSALPLLEELVVLPFDKSSVSINFMIGFLKDFDSVNHCMFYCRDTKADVIKCCGIKWNAQIIPHDNSLTVIKLARSH